MWNVNTIPALSFESVALELIETLWNVNSGMWVMRRNNRIRINRNIVECKYNSDSDLYLDNVELIETLWNVNFFKESKYVDEEMRINRNIVECK